MSDRLDLSSLQSAINSLAESLAVVGDKAWFSAQSPSVKNTLIAGVIQNFEFTYESCVKMVRRRMELDAASPTEIDQDSFRDLIRSAYEKGLVSDPTRWFGYRKMRNLTSHTYEESIARSVFKGIGAFLADARALLVTLKERNG
jgi:nucleotidyltransferase substrate binding protein (TIGR01987 family)